MGDLTQKYITGTTAVKIAAEIEQAIRDGGLVSGERLPPIRVLAGDLGVNPATVAAAYQMLQSRALLISQGRQGTRVTHRPLAMAGNRGAEMASAAARRRPAIITGAMKKLADGNPDPALLPDFRKILRDLKYSPRLYGEPMMHTGLIKLMRREMERDGIRAGQCAVVNGTMDGLDRLIAEHLRPGDRVAVEDPGFTGHHDLIASRGLTLVPVRIDDQGMLPDSFEQACKQGVQAILITPRAQSPTGATLTAERARELRRILQKSPKSKNALVIEDDHLSFLCEEGPALQHLYDPRSLGGSPTRGTPTLRVGSHDAERRGTTGGRWAHLRSLSKSFNPDLRLAVMTGDDHTMTRLLDRLIVVERWVSHILQATAYALLSDKTVRAQVRKAGRIYNDRRNALIDALSELRTHNSELRTQNLVLSTGYNIWLPVDEETPTVQALAARGWAVAAGERFRLTSPPGIRITASRLQPKDALRFAADVREVLHPARGGATV